MDTASLSPSAKRQPLTSYVSQQLEARLRKVAFELRRSRQAMNEEHVHDLRVALRRLMESIRVAKDILPEKGAGAVLDDLHKIMKDAGDVRSCDIASGLLRSAGAPADAPLLKQLAERRALSEKKLFDRAQHAYRRNATLKWRTQLRLGARAMKDTRA